MLLLLSFSFGLFFIAAFVFHLKNNFVRSVLLSLINYLIYYLVAGSWGILLIAINLTTYAMSFLLPRFKSLGFLVFVQGALILSYLRIYLPNFSTVNLDTSSAASYMGLLNLALPIGLSIVVMQSMSYLIDVTYKNEQRIHSLFDFLALSSFFPLLFSGPVISYSYLKNEFNQTRDKPFNSSLALDGILLVGFGVFKKMAIAERIAPEVQKVFEFGSTPLLSFLTVLVLPFYLYVEYSSLIDIIRGTSKIIGVDLPLNYDQPLWQTSFHHNLKKWNMTVFQWIRHYLYGPLLKIGSSALDKIFWKTLGVFLLALLIVRGEKIFVLAALLAGGYILSEMISHWIAKLEYQSVANVMKLVLRFFSYIALILMSVVILSPKVATGSYILKSILYRDFKMFGNAQFAYLQADIKLAYFLSLAVVFIEPWQSKLKASLDNSSSIIKWSLYGVLIFMTMLFYSGNIVNFRFLNI